MDNSAASAAAGAGTGAAQAIAAALPTGKAAATLSVASFLRGYQISAPRGNRPEDGSAAQASASSSVLATVAASAGNQSSSSTGVTEKAVTLDSNDQFADVIRQALGENPLPTPQRIAVELQTPPGATVTVFFSQSNGQLRAQLSASDPASLHWLQQQVGGLREGGSTAASVVWLPPQLDQQQSGGQGQRSPQQQQQPQQQPGQTPSAEDLALAESIFGGMEAART